MLFKEQLLTINRSIQLGFKNFTLPFERIRDSRISGPFKFARGPNEKPTFAHDHASAAQLFRCMRGRHCRGFVNSQTRKNTVAGDDAVAVTDCTCSSAQALAVAVAIAVVAVVDAAA